MPVASSQKDAQNQLLQHYQHLLPKSPTYHLGGQLSPGSLVPSSEHFIGREEGATYVSDLRPLTALQASATSERNASFFSTHSPPLINLSPNLSPTAEPQRVSPFYDLRETTRRRSFYGMLRLLTSIDSTVESLLDVVRKVRNSDEKVYSTARVPELKLMLMTEVLNIEPLLSRLTKSQTVDYKPSCFLTIQVIQKRSHHSRSALLHM